jgi:hypothetical protein
VPWDHGESKNIGHICTMRVGLSIYSIVTGQHTVCCCMSLSHHYSCLCTHYSAYNGPMPVQLPSGVTVWYCNWEVTLRQVYGTPVSYFCYFVGFFDPSMYMPKW